MASKLKAISRAQLDAAGLLKYLDVVQSLSAGLNSSIVPYLNTGDELPDKTVQGPGPLPWPVTRVPDPNNANKKKAVVTPDWSLNIGDVADVVRLMGWALQTKRASVKIPWMHKLGSVPPAPGPRPVLRQGDALLEYIDDVIDIWPPSGTTDYQACLDIYRTVRVMLNAMLAGNPDGDGGGGNQQLPPDGGG